MMLYASQGVRSAARKASNVVTHHGGYNGHGGSTTANATSRSLHIGANLQNAARAAHPPIPTLESIRPRNPPHKLFSVSKNFLQRFFAYLTTPGFRGPTHFADVVGPRSLHNAAFRGSTICDGLSLPVRQALKNNAIRRQANTFLPRAPAPAPPRCGGVAQVGLGTARNFSTGRPIFQHLAENVPIVGRALYEVDWDLDMRKESKRMHTLAENKVKKVSKTQEMIKPVQKKLKQQAIETEGVTAVSAQDDFAHYFHAVSTPAITTYLLIPLAPTPTTRVPLRPDPGRSDALLPPLSYLGALHGSYSTHTLRVSSLFTRLDQANVWARGVYCSAYSQGQQYQCAGTNDGESGVVGEGVCTTLTIEFRGWTKAEVRSVIGESGTGWCVLEEVVHEEITVEEDLSDMDSLCSGDYDDQHTFGDSFGMREAIDPTQSFILPTLDLSATPSSSPSFFSSFPPQMENDPWLDDDSDGLVSSLESSYSDLSSLIIDPPSVNGYFGLSSRYEHARGMSEPRETMFY
ncbi:hypothetical protein NLJ89_g672 [Agrocybe chaxingu]|uniref:Uncharacterized protein n=1 Tax=Agrocybe chaxingu TaxID=84603 RepID=A0A9W8N1M9_9AGAR|nr:hypothetical protein NLJ89_g672 [Agrocybe chaxingu]